MLFPWILSFGWQKYIVEQYLKKFSQCVINNNQEHQILDGQIN